MRLATVTLPPVTLPTVTLPDSGAITTTAAAFVDGEWRELGAPDLGEALRAGITGSPGRALPGAVPTLPLPHPAKVICCGLNYGDHILETGRDKPEYPTLFAKYADTLTAPDAEIRLPKNVDVDWEVELAVVVGRSVRNASRDEAADAIAGYTFANDISVRDWQYRTLQWFQGKAWDATTPLGPVVVTPDEFDVEAAEVVCVVSGVERQRGRVNTLVFDSADLIAYVSTFTELRPGDILLTGTPGGVGTAMTPPTFLKDGDLLESSITGIGTLTNRITLT
jgi:acylpyruvate hydrolase